MLVVFCFLSTIVLFIEGESSYMHVYRLGLY